MSNNLQLIGSLAGVTGALVCAVSGLARIGGMYYLLGFQSTTVFNAGIGLMVFACLLKLEAVSRQAGR